MAYKAHEQKGILLNANEFPITLNDQIRSEMAQMITTTIFNRYPDDSAARVKKLYAQYLGITPDMILPANGSDQALQLLIGTFAPVGKVMLTVDPDFEMYDFYADSYGTRLLKYPLEKDGSFSLDDFIEKAKEENASLILFSNPHNPTGHVLTPDQVKKMAKALPDTVIAMDEAYMDFAQVSAISLLEELDNLYITRTLSKAWGLAGLRMGFVISTPKNIAWLDPYRTVYNVSSLNQDAASVVLSHPEFLKANLDLVLSERARVFEELKKIESLHALESSTNFILTWPENYEKLDEALKKANITVRRFPARKALRFTIGLPEENDALLAVLKENA